MKIVQALVEAGAFVNAKNFNTDTPFSIACEKGHLEIAEYLLNAASTIHGADKL